MALTIEEFGCLTRLVFADQLTYPGLRAVRTPIPSAAERPREHAAFLESLGVMQRLGLVYEQNDCREPHLLAIARDFPNLRIVLCHCTGDHLSSPEEAQAWRGTTEALSKLPNVFAKMGGAGSPHRNFGLSERATPIGSAELADMVMPWYSHLIRCFGTDRCMFETNWPVDKQSFSYVVVWNAYKRVCQRLGLDREQAVAVCGGTAQRL
jgi:L-fuconolactonase